jgi:hypothetical protein
MSSTATKKRAHADAIANLASSWIITEVNYKGPNGPLSGLNGLEISVLPTVNLVLGYARRLRPLTDYAIKNGAVSIGADKLEISFELTVDGGSYALTGLLNSTDVPPYSKIIGTIIDLVDLEVTEEGTWSAQAQGGPGDGDDEKKHSHKHAKRDSQ